MDVILKVLDGAKVGTKIAVKKSEFLVGRSQKCHLCVGSSSVSRRHCMIARKDNTVTIKDLGSRNGTVVNDEKITEEVQLSSGDELRIGSLKLLLTITHGINNQKRPKVKNVAEAVHRTATADDSTLAEDDISQWLLEAPSSTEKPQFMKDTQTIRMDDTNAMQVKEALQEQEAAEPPQEEATSGDDSTEESTAKSKKNKKPAPGKLPPVITEPSSKDSREAAMQALRNWNRRR